MASNLEVKAVLAETELAIARAHQIGAHYAATIHQIDIYFRTDRGRLKLRLVDREPAELIFYDRDETADRRLSRFERCMTADPERLRALLESAYGVRGVVEKRRVLWMFQETRIHFDQVKGLGSFLEIEVPVGESLKEAESAMERLLEGFQIAPSSYLRASYIDLIAKGAEGGAPKAHC